MLAILELSPALATELDTASLSKTLPYKDTVIQLRAL